MIQSIVQFFCFSLVFLLNVIGVLFYPMSLTTSQLIALMSIPRIGKKTALKIGASFLNVPSDEEYLKMLSDGKVWKKSIDKLNLIKGLEHAKDVLERSEKLNIRSINCYEDHYPEQLRTSTLKDGKANLAPPVIFYKGNIELLNTNCLLIIGSRNCDKYGQKAAYYLAEQFASRGVSIVSGLAIGCDTAAHKGAIKGGKTVAILGSGLDLIYPRENDVLAREILDNDGLLLSEYEIGTQPTKYTFVERDLIQAAVSYATIVVQTSKTGGSIHAAKATTNLGKKLFTVKFSDPAINSSDVCKGNKILVEEYGATYIEASSDLSQMKNYLDKITEQIWG